MKKYFISLVLITSLCVVLSQLGLVGLPFEGTWHTSGGDEAFAWYQDYTFRAGNYSMEGYPPIAEEGSYSVVLRDENSYTLLMQPDSEDDFLLKLSVYDNTMMMSSYSATGGSTFTR